MSPAGRDRGRGAGAGDLHADPGLRARLPRVPGQGAAGLRGRLTCSSWPFFERAPPRVRGVGGASICRTVDGDDARRALPRARARARADGWLRARASGEPLDVRTLCLARETLAYHDALADFAFAMQGLGSGADLAVRRRRRCARATCPAVAAGEKIAAFALSEPEAGSDVAAMTTTARDGDRLNGTKTWISNGGIADFYTVFARARPRASARTSSTPTRRRGRRAHRRDRAAPARAARVRRRARPSCSGRPGKGMQDRAGDARRLPLDRRRGRAGLRAPRARRGARARAASASCSARRWPSCRSCRPSSPTWRSASTRARCSSTARRGRRTSAAGA